LELIKQGYRAFVSDSESSQGWAYSARTGKWRSINKLYSQY
jgi:hypothetical protein